MVAKASILNSAIVNQVDRRPFAVGTAFGLACMLAVTAMFATSSVAQDNSSGKFIGKVVAEWLDDGRRMKLRAPFGYRSPSGRSWNVPEDTVVDGATIPGFLWSLTGGPFEGRYRAASVIHDYYCAKRQRRWEDVHRVFYEAMLTSGVGARRAWLMYKAVETFGPRWDPPKINPKCQRPDGSLDLEHCTQNNAMIVSPIEWPKYNEGDVQSFLKNLEASADPEDIETLSSTVRQP